MRLSRDLRARARVAGFDPGYLGAFEKKVFIEGEDAIRRLTDFFVLLALATAIATYGVLAESTATVIGAMIVAPLMGPIMATAAAVVMGSARRTLRSLALVIVGSVGVILLSLLLSVTFPAVPSAFHQNTEVTSRIAPGLLALLTALASGAAGAYISAHEEIADSMGGVAIAISLVPPLCVIGIAIGQGEWGAAGGAATLFLTNFLAILLAGGVTFALGGLGKLAVRREERGVRASAFGFIVAATLLVAIPLTATTMHVVHLALDTQAATGDVTTWLEGTSYALEQVSVDGERVVAVVSGQGELHSLQELAHTLAATLGRAVNVEVQTIPSVRASAGEGGHG